MLHNQPGIAFTTSTFNIQFCFFEFYFQLFFALELCKGSPLLLLLLLLTSAPPQLECNQIVRA